MPRRLRRQKKRVDSRAAHETLATVTLASAAMMGAAAGALAAALMTGILGGSAFLGSVWLGKTPAPEDFVEAWREEEASTVSVVRQLAPAVVSIKIKKALSADPEAPLTEVGGGTGFFVSEDGLIVTNRHVVNDPAASYFVVTNDGAELSATVAATDPFLDVAILDVEGAGYPVATLGNSDRVKIGQTVVAVGNALSEFHNSVTKGIVSGVNREVSASDGGGQSSLIERAIQTDAAINLGNSGGPLINLAGEVVGINTAISIEGQSVGFAIPINDVKKAVADVARYGRVLRPWLGVRYVLVTPTLAKERGLLFDHGALLVRGSQDSPAVLPESPAEKAGLKEGDVILSVNGQAIDPSFPLIRAMEQLAPGQTVFLRIVRGDATQEVAIMLAELPVTIP